MSCPRLKALHDIYSKLEKNYKEISQKHRNESDFVPAKEYSKHSNDLSSNPERVQCFSEQSSDMEATRGSRKMKENRTEDNEDPLIAAFYQQEAKKLKLQNDLPIDDWATLHFTCGESQFDVAPTVIYTNSTSKDHDKDKVSDEHDECKDFEIARKLIKEKLIQKLVVALENPR